MTHCAHTSKIRNSFQRFLSQTHYCKDSSLALRHTHVGTALQSIRLPVNLPNSCREALVTSSFRPTGTSYHCPKVVGLSLPGFHLRCYCHFRGQLCLSCCSTTMLSLRQGLMHLLSALLRSTVMVGLVVRQTVLRL